jgi:autotransporter-associated beta strand protein
MNTLKSIVIKLGSFGLKSILPLVVCGMTLPAFGQLKWSSYDTNGTLVAANMATGGDAASGGSVTFTIPANTQMTFITKSFTPINLTPANAAAVVTFRFSASAGLTGVIQKTFGWGLYNSGGTASLADDIGMYGDWQGSYIEGLFHGAGSANLWTGTSPGLGKTTTGTPTDGITYTNQIRLFMKTTPVGVALGSSSSTLAAAGLAMNGGSLTARSYTNPSNGTNTFDEFAFMFNNTTANPVTVTLSGIGLGTSMTWDASGASPVAPTDGGGTWSAGTANWSSGVGGAIGASDSVWSPGYNAIIGSGGAGGTITNTDTTTIVGNITINTNYTLTGTALTLTNSTITVAGSATTATINNILTGTGGLTVAGGGTLSLAETANNIYTGDTIINNGTVQVGGTAGQLYIPGNLVINPNGAFSCNSGISSGGQGVFGGANLIINGGAVFVGSGGAIVASTAVLANNGSITNAGGTTSSTYSITNLDGRSGAVLLTRHGFGLTNLLYKSTAGTVRLGTRPNSSANDGFVVTLNAGTLLIDKGYANNASSTLKANLPLTFAGGALVISNGLSTLAPSTVNPSPAGVFFNSGASSLYMYNAGSSGGAMTMGPLTRRPGATLNYIPPYGSVGVGIGSSTANVNGIVGGWNTYGLTDWTTGTANWTALAAGSYNTSLDPTTWLTTDNVSLNGNTSGPVPNGTTINSLRLTAASTVTLSGVLTNSSGGLLVTGSGATAITGGTLYGASGADLIVHQNASAALTISSTLADNGAATSLTKDGAGTLIISVTDNMTGTNYLNGGVVQVDNLAELASGPLDMNGGTLRYTGTDTPTSSRAVVTRGLGPTFDIASATVTQTGAINGSGDAIGDLGGITKIGAGKLILTAINNYNGETVVNNGILSINGTNNYNPAVWGAGKVTVNGGTLGGTGTINGPVTANSGGTIAPGDAIGTLTLATNLTLQSGSTSSFVVTNSPGTSDLLVVQGNLTVSNSTIAINVTGTSLQPGTYTLIQYSGQLIGSFNPVVTLVGGSINGSMTISTSTAGRVNLVLIPQVAITSQPQSAIASTNDTVCFTVSATGSAPISYQWYFTTNLSTPASPISGATNSSYCIASADGTNNGLYSVVVTNNYNSVTSSIATLIVGNVLPQLNGPFNQTVIQGNNATFSGTVVLANPQPTLQWQTNYVNVSGATSTNLTLNNVQYAALNNATVSLIASNAAGLVTNNATLTVIITPVITPQPASTTVNAGATASFVSGATGIPTPGLQWYKNTVGSLGIGVGISGQTNGTLTINNAQGSDIGIYTIVATNAAGGVTNAGVKLTVNSTTLATTTLLPANNAPGICYDTPLYITFNGPVSVVNSGKVRIYDSTNSVTPVDIIDMSSNTVIVSTLNTGIYLTNNVQPHSLFSGDTQVINYFPVITTGSTAAIYPHSGVMTSNQTYYVTMDNGVVVDSAGAYFAGISDTNAWRFTTKATGPANPTNLVVAADGSGDFLTVQGAVDSVLPGNTNYTLINIKNGNYVEIVDISGKNNITFRGQSRAGTVVGYGNNNNLTGTTAGRMAFKVNSTNIGIENLTLVNTTPQGGSQAETLLIYNNGVRCVVNNCEIDSRQDTILINAGTSQGYFYNCRVTGNFDYVWGVGVGYFYKCVFHTTTNIYSGSYNLTAARTTTAGTLSTNTPWVNPGNGTTFSANGFSFVSCTIEADTGVTGITMAGSNGTAGGLDSWVNCLIDINAYVTPTLALSNTYVFWQYNNKDITGVNPISFANIQTIGVTNNDPRLLAATNVPVWFYGWTPQLAPNIIGQPANVTVSQGQATNFTVSATGIPDPTYQWQHAGTNVPGGTSATLTIASPKRSDGGNYTVVVSNGSGSVTSSVAVLNYTGNVAPVASPSTYSRQAGFSLKIAIAGDLSTYWSDADGDPVALTGAISSTNGATVSYDSNFVYYSNPNDVADQINYMIGDGQGGSNSGVINITVSTGTSAGGSQPVTVTGNSATVTFAGIPNSSYEIQRSTNLSVWVTIYTTNVPSNGVFQYTDNFSDLGGIAPPEAYYRTATP